MYGSSERISALRAARDDRLLRLGDRQARRISPASSVIRPSSPITDDLLEAVGATDLEVVESCPGVILSAPVPNSGST